MGTRWQHVKTDQAPVQHHLVFVTIMICSTGTSAEGWLHCSMAIVRRMSGMMNHNTFQHTLYIVACSSHRCGVRMLPAHARSCTRQAQGRGLWIPPPAAQDARVAAPRPTHCCCVPGAVVLEFVTELWARPSHAPTCGSCGCSFVAVDSSTQARGCSSEIFLHQSCLLT